MAEKIDDDIILEAIFNPCQQGVTHDRDDNCKQCDIDEGLELDVLQKVKQMEVEAVNAAENGDFRESLKLFNNAINIAPTHASTFNNRAQLHRLQGDIDAAIKDLNTAIELSKGQGNVASQAYTQRALLKKLQKDEDGAYHDFKMAASLGNPFAKSQVIQSNPYAALCNQMLSQAFDKLKKGETD